MSTTIWLKAGIAIAAAAALAGCGTTPGDRGLSGGLLGAGSGAAIGALAGNAGEGALIGGLGGMAIGALTSPDAINLGDPPWHHTASAQTRRHYASRTSQKSGNCTVKETQSQRITTCAKARS
ncbi:MAG TPA: hypothetical protein VNW15_05690 [Rhizomicrobium sp.]|jgi:osmotically inducible lipoprotein OsmB|nr:hypothetical protein [Rhizomicrobium sp.]